MQVFAENDDEGVRVCWCVSLYSNRSFPLFSQKKSVRFSISGDARPVRIRTGPKRIISTQKMRIFGILPNRQKSAKNTHRLGQSTENVFSTPRIRKYRKEVYCNGCRSDRGMPGMEDTHTHSHTDT